MIQQLNKLKEKYGQSNTIANIMYVALARLQTLIESRIFCE